MVQHKLSQINLGTKAAERNACGSVSIYLNKPKNSKEFGI